MAYCLSGPVNEDKAARYHRLRRRAESSARSRRLRPSRRCSSRAPRSTCARLGSILGALIGRGFEEPGTVVGFTLALAHPAQCHRAAVRLLPGLSCSSIATGCRTRPSGQWAARPGEGARHLQRVSASLARRLVYATLRWSPHWWWAASAALLVLAMIGIVQLAPVLLLPLFYRFKPLDRPALVERLLALAARAQTRMRGRLRVGAERAHQESQRGAGRHGPHAADSALRHAAGGLFRRRDRSGAGARAVASRPSRSVARDGAAGACCSSSASSRRTWRCCGLPTRSRCAAWTIRRACRCCCWWRRCARSCSMPLANALSRRARAARRSLCARHDPRRPPRSSRR